jgi:amino acid adenylation domain-containing protein
MPASDPQRCDDVDVSLFAQFEQVAAATPHASAVSDTNETLTYQALLANATRYCAGLQAAAVKPGDVVGVATPRSAQTIALLLGINRAGASWLALDPTWPEERIAAMLADARPVLIVTDTELGPSTGAVGPVYRSLVDLHGDAASARTAPPAANAFILFTSGSTGRPKGAALPAAGVLNRCRWMWRAYGFSHSDRFAQRSSLNFVDSAWEIFGPLLHGAELVVMPQPLAADPAGLVSWLDAERISHLVTVPALLDALLREDLSHVASLRSVITSGEALLPDLLLRFQQALPDCVLLNTYGATEFWDASCARVDQLDVTDLLRVPIGKPIPNMRGDIVNRDGQLLPPGMPGELCVSGINVARGYLANAELSAEKFSTSSDGEPQYRTGDLAISAADGAIELLGRADRQFKLNGIRVEPTDIEANALACDGVVSAAVVLAEHETATRPVLFVLAGPGKPLDANRVRRFMEQRLPLAIVPADVRVLEDWPFTPSGKTDLRKLTERIQASLEPTRFVPARNDTERMIADVWQDVLNVDKVGAQADFFALGGHSLLATRVIARLTEAAGVELPLTSLFEQRTVERLAESIDALRSLSAQAALPDAGDESREVFRL